MCSFSELHPHAPGEWDWRIVGKWKQEGSEALPGQSWYIQLTWMVGRGSISAASFSAPDLHMFIVSSEKSPRCTTVHAEGFLFMIKNQEETVLFVGALCNELTAGWSLLLHSFSGILLERGQFPRGPFITVHTAPTLKLKLSLKLNIQCELHTLVVFYNTKINPSLELYLFLNYE